MQRPFNDIVSMDVNFWKISFKESREKKTNQGAKHRGYRTRMHIAIQVAAQTAETIWKAFATGWLQAQDVFGVDPHSSQIAIFVEPTLAEAHWQKGQVEKQCQVSATNGYKILEDIDVSEGDFQTTA